MKKTFYLILAAAFFAALSFTSCLSSNQEASSAEEKSSSAAKDEGIRAVKQHLQDLKITVVSAPKQTVKGKAFSAPYRILVTTQSGTPYAGMKIAAEYPSSRTGDSVSFARQIIVTDEAGSAVFTPPVPEFSVKSQVSFAPYVESSSSEVARLCSAVTVTAPCLVRTSETQRTWILVSVVDYNKNAQVITGGGAQPSTQALTAVLWKNGLTGAQNADFHNSINADDPAKIKAEALKLTRGNAGFRYVVYGRVKYASDITQEEDGRYSVTLKGELGVLNLATGEVVLKAAKTATAKDKSQWNVLKMAQDNMALQFGEEVVYGL